MNRPAGVGPLTGFWDKAMSQLLTSVQADSDFPEQLAGIDLGLGLELLSGKKPLYLAMLRKFLAGHKQTDTAIRRALAANDPEQAERLAHNLKGVAGCLGMTVLQRRAADLETAFRVQRADLEPLLLCFEAALDEVMSDLEMKLPEESAPMPEAGPLPANTLPG